MLSHNFGSLLKKRVPIIVWLPNYTKQDALSDLIAGVTVGLTLMPQAIAYAALAGLEPQYGLYSGCAGILMYVIFGGTKQITIGPTALLSLLTYNYTHDFGASNNADLAVFFTFLVGIIELLCGILQLGFLVNFVSTPVISGFTSAAALIIASAQLKNLFGLKYKAETFIDIWREFFKHISETKLYDAILGFICIIILVVLKKMNGTNYNVKDLSRLRVLLHRALWIITTGRNALVVVICAYLAYHFKQYQQITPFTLTGSIYSGMPTVKFPLSSAGINRTEVGFIEMVSHLGSGLIVVPLIGVISNLALAKAFSNGGQVDATQEMIALGMCNIVGSFVQSMPVAGAFSRSAVNNSSGVRTTFGCVYTSLLVFLTLSFLTPYFYYIPRASLAAVIVAAVLLMIDVDIIIKPLWSVHKNDLFPGLVTFTFSLIFGIEIGLVAGIIIDIILILYQTARPTVSVERITGPSGISTTYWSVEIRCDVIMFPAVDHIRGIVFDKILIDNNNYKSKGKIDQSQEEIMVVIDCLHVQKIDFTAAQGLNSLLIDLRRYNIQLFLLIKEKRDLVRSITKLCPDMIVVSSVEELQLIFQKSKENNIFQFVVDDQDKNKKLSSCKTMLSNNKISVINVTEVTRC